MKSWSSFAGTIAFLVAIPPVLSAQWPAHPNASVPRTPDGKSNLSAPAPRTPDGKPDLSGIWNNQFFGGPPGAPRERPDNEPPLATFFNIGAGFKDGLPLQPWAADLLKKRREDHSKDNPDAHCLPMGLLQFHEHPQPRKIVQTRDLIVIIYEANYGLRQIFLDGRPLPNNDPQPWWYGYSIGKWVGDELVVETTGFRDGGWLDIWGSPLTDAAKLTERFRRINYGKLQIDVTIDDPKAYTKPFTVRFEQNLSVDETDLIEFICNENEQSVPHMFGKDGPPNTTATAFKIDPRVFDQYVGRYQFAPGIQIEVTRQDSRLFAQITGQPPFELFASSEREFYLMVFDARFTFVVEGQGRASALLMHTDTDQRAARVD
jgi:Domain of unknown function (DUF3471)